MIDYKNNYFGKKSSSMKQFIVTIGVILFVVNGYTQEFKDISQSTGLNTAGNNHGVAIGDVNQDGLDDIYISQRGGSNQLYINTGNFQFQESAHLYGLDYEGDTNMSLWFDMDNDGDLDLVLGNKFEPIKLLENEGSTFTDVTAQYGINANGNLRSLNAVDYDNDGDLDLYIALLLEQNQLLRNDGDQFRDVTLQSGINDPLSSMAAVWFDYDNDGDQDLYQCHDGNQANLFYENLGNGTFLNRSQESNTDYEGFGMGTEVADFNNDGYLDIYLTNLYENVLFLNTGQKSFMQIAQGQDINDRGMGWGTFAFDCDNDGLKDIYIANETEFVVDGEYIPNKLLSNAGNGQFIESLQNDVIWSDLSSYGAAYADLDQNGMLDIIVANYDDLGNQLFQNQSESQNYVQIRLEGELSNSHGIGARVELKSGDHYQMDQITAGSGYASQNSQALHFGIGDLTSVDELIIHWPSGITQTIDNPTINTDITITENQSVISTGQVVWTEPAFPTQFDDVTVYFDAKEGNKALEGFGGSVYAHTGVITTNSSSPTDWKYVQGTWGVPFPKTLMTPIGDDVYTLEYNIEEYYGIPDGELVQELAFVFRNTDGSIVGRASDGADIFTPVYAPSIDILTNLITPTNGNTIIYLGDSINVSLQVNREATISISDNGVEVSNTTSDAANIWITPTELGFHEVEIFVQDAEGNSQTVTTSYFVLDPNETLQNPPANTKNGLNYRGGQSYVFQLYAPGKENVFLLCPENNYRIDLGFQLNKAEDEATFWIELPKLLFEGGKNTYQYLVDGGITVADPYAKVVLDPWNDSGVPTDVMAELPDYPAGADGIVTVFDLEEDDYDWMVNDFEPPAKNELIIYEILMRDFLNDKNYKSLLDTLDYLDRLGATAIQLMPINEFEGNQSWGYNPSYHMAIDKYYGSRDQLKAVIDECHRRGMAVILDVVYNHVFSQSPLAQLYWDPVGFRPTPDNPWLNVTARHPFNVGYDVNHESQATKDWVKQILENMITEYRFDGFRFDLSKGFTQKNSGDNSDLMSQYDQSRIDILTEYANHIWSLDADNYVILEHFAYNEEEIVLANAGMMLWGNMTHDFGKAAEGRTSDLEWLDYKVRGWNDPHVIGYMESHDEERLAYKILNFGTNEGDYDTRDFDVAMRRIAAASSIFTLVPGPKMLWQFGELGYDYSINRCTNGSISPDCRLDPKPIRWDYQVDEDRAFLYNRVAAINHLKKEYATFSTDDYIFDDSNLYLKRLQLNHAEMDAVVLTNFRTRSTDFNPKFPYEGTWYEYFTGEELEVTNVNEKLPFLAGEYRIYTSEKIVPPGGFITNQDELVISDKNIYPNPLNGNILFIVDDQADQVSRVELIDITGTLSQVSYSTEGNRISVKMNESFCSGIFTIRIYHEDKLSVGRFVKM